MSRFDYALFDAALHDLESIESWFRCERQYPEYRSLWKMKMELKLLKTFYTCAREWNGKFGFLEHERDEDARPGVMLTRIEDLVCKISNEAQSLSLASGHDYSLVLNMISGFRTTINAMKRDVIKLSFMFSANSLEYRLVEIIPIVITNFSENLMDLLCCVNNEDLRQLIEALVEKLKFFNNFICFARMQGVEFMQLKDLYGHLEVVAIKAARLIFMWGFYFRNNGELLAQVQLQKTQLLEKIKLVDPCICQICVQLLTAAKLSRSSCILTSKENGDIAANFIDTLLCRLWELFDYDSSFMISAKDQMQRLYEGLRFLRTILRDQHKFKELIDTTEDLICLLVIDAGTVVCSLCRNVLKEGLAKQTDLLLFDLLKVIEYIKSRAAQEYLLTSSSSFPTTNELGFLDSLLEKLEQLSKCEADPAAFPKDLIKIFLENLLFLRSFLNIIVHQRNQNTKFQTLWSRVMEVAYKAEIIIDYVTVNYRPDCYPMSFDTINEDINLIKMEALEIYDSDIEGQKTTTSYSHMPSQVSTPTLDEVVVGLDDEAETLIERLVRGTRQLDIVPIVGMAGQGKTTLAKRVYNDQLIMCHFHVRAWCCVSQGYQRQSLLRKIFSDIVDELPSQYLQMNEDDLAEALYRHLKGKRYLIVLDDIWGIEVWNEMEISFPNDANGSRVLCTSRLHNLSSEFKLDCKPHPLRPLTDEESWALLQQKLFAKKACPPQLCALGEQIAKSCKGLPLAVVVVAGLLATIQQHRWEEVAKSLGSSILSDNELCINTFELSYKHLPDYLKPCFLYFGAFREDQEIPVQRLTLLWISEGFVGETGVKSLEDVANEYLMDLIDRSLVMVSQQRSVGGVKTCQIHDLLHEFVIRKAKEESFLQILHGYDELYTFNAPYNPYRLGIYADAMAFKKSRFFCPHLRCLLFFCNTRFELEQIHDFSFLFRIFKLLKVLDLGDYDLGQNFPMEVLMLVHLTYLVIRCAIKSIPSAIFKLSRLETFELKGSKSGVMLPNTVWMMTNLRHLSIARCQIDFRRLGGFIFPIDDLEKFPNLYHLGTCVLGIGSYTQRLEKILAKLPNIRRLKCVHTSEQDYTLHYKGEIVLEGLGRLQSLHMAGIWGFVLDYPVNLRKLTLSSNGLPWSEISKIGKLPNLEVLKLLHHSFVGKEWEMTEGAFPKLRFLKLESLTIVRWTACCDDLPPLEKLVLCGCLRLKEIPSCLGNVPTIEMIEVRSCHKSAVNLVKEIQEEQMDLGNESLKIVIR